MTTMKDSGNPWVREIPSDWFEKKLRYLVKLRGEKSVTTDYKKYVGLENIMSQTGQYVQTGIEVDLTENLTFEVGDILFGKLRPYLRKYWRAEFSGTASSEFVIIKGSSLNLKFLFWAIQSDSFINDVDSSTYGSKMPRASWEYMKNIKLPFPESIEEQAKIADFLDKKVAQLDKVKSLLEEQIKTLEDYRQSLIYETVTKGLDKTVPLKDSGVDWIGQIPEGWGVKPIKYLVSTPVTDGPHETPTLYDEGIPFLSAESVKNGILDFRYKRGYISETAHKIFSRKVSPQKNDIFIVKSGATTGNVGIVNTDEIFDIWSPLALVRTRSDLANQKFIYYFMLSDAFTKQIQNKWSFGTQQNIGMGVIEKIKLVVPPLGEQTPIADFLDKNTEQINQMIAIKKEQIENINKQRQTLIYDYVTGKRRI
ncbi:restriction endonuclease subunit S [Streptococcus suis]|nr:restriction endonuclease subunit S [Streptococcus suis]